MSSARIIIDKRGPITNTNVLEAGDFFRFFGGSEAFVTLTSPSERRTVEYLNLHNGEVAEMEVDGCVKVTRLSLSLAVLDAPTEAGR